MFNSSAAHLFIDIPIEVFHCQIFIHFEYSWVYRVFRLICRQCNCIATGTSTNYSFGNELHVYLRNDIHRTRRFVECCEKGYFQHVNGLKIFGGQELSQFSKDMDLEDELLHTNEEEFATRLDRYLNCFPNLQKLELAKRYFDHSVVKGMASFQNLKSLTHLDLSSAQVHDKSIQIIASNPLFSNLTFLNLSQTKTSIVSVQSICSSPYMSNLKELQYSRCRMGDVLLHDISQSMFLKNLTSLHVSGNNITSSGVKYIGKSSVFNNLTCLHIDINEISEDGIVYLASCENLSNVETFNFEFNISNGTHSNLIATILNGPMKKLKRVRFSSKGLSDIEKLVACKNITSLKSLNLMCGSITDDEWKLITNCSGLSNLEALQLDCTHITNLTPLATSEYIKNLTSLEISGNYAFKESAFIELTKEFPKLKQLCISDYRHSITIDTVLHALEHHLQCLETLTMRCIDFVSCEKVEQFASLDSASKLVSLCVTLKKGFIPYLFGKASKLENLTRLCILEPPIELDDAHALASTPLLSQLTHLQLPGFYGSRIANVKKQVTQILEKSPYLYKVNGGEKNQFESAFW
ncbi:hypothetical protein C9374_007271 [Naegleria lovaniensis]|uniref:Uncharacterized protein n=1 Tax=Naegleria lovaniensis TaxID=51637 RepID=A0AA88GZC6_NAELO|nr:uncharacterized protein C9374_007271 [Naegleria lovaniensis]KAG2393740.1 hypothetical protein C9374_007271 [Naegleria lovaniensis]